MSKGDYFDPKENYGPGEALRDMLIGNNGPKDVRFTSDGIMKEFDGHIEEVRSNPNDPRGHDTIRYVFDSNGKLDPSKSGFDKH